MTRSEIIKFLILRTIGNFLVLLAIFGVFATFGPALAEEAKFRIAQARGVRYTVGGERPGSGSFADLLTGPKEQVLLAKDTDFSLVIPKIGASAKVFANVDSANESVFLPILKLGIAHARGTVFPGMKGNTYLFAHSTDNFWNAGSYNATFYLLKDLAIGDDVVVFFQNRRYNYSVLGLQIMEPEDVSLIVKSQEQENERLILQTCWPPGTTWKRLIVTAKPK